MTATLAQLRAGFDPVYEAKQIHPVPAAPSVGREEFLLGRCRGKIVLDVGASGPMHDMIERVAKRCYGIDMAGMPLDQWVKGGKQGVLHVNLDSEPFEDGTEFGRKMLPELADVELVVCGEVLEHLSNPGRFLDNLRADYHMRHGGHCCPVIFTVPNAFSDVARLSLETGIECVNIQHCAYYSYHTLKELVTRHGYRIDEHYWYKGRPRFSEGLIFVCS
jgi:hypothetical protein